MDKYTEDMLTVKEWAEKAGLKLFNYDGFTHIFSKLSGNSDKDFQANLASRFRDAGDLLCTRKAFESHVMGCTMEYPQISQYEKMVEVIPGFVESDINFRISATMGLLKHSTTAKYDMKAKLEELLTLVRHKVNAREKNIEINGINEETEISELDESRFTPEQLSIINKYNGTLEGMEANLSNEVIQTLEKTLQKRSVKLSELPLDKIGVLTSILYNTARQKIDQEVDEKFMYINIPGQKKKPFIQPYSIIDGKGMKSGVAFDLDTEGGRIKGAMSTTPDVDRKIKESIGHNTNTEETSQALEVIDRQVSPEQRRTLSTRLREFAKKIYDKIRGNNQER